MVRAIRIATAAVMALAVAALPVILDGCVESCARHSDTSATTPACHRASSTAAAGVGRAPLACGHDHSGIADLAKVAAPVGRDVHVLAAIHNLPGSVISILSAYTHVDSAPPGPAPIAVRAIALRI